MRELPKILLTILILIILFAINVFLGLICFVGLVIYLTIQENKKKQEERKQNLLKKYDDEEIANKIMNKTLWIGQSRDQLLDSLGEPIEKDIKVQKNKRTEVWKYYQSKARKNSYNLKISIENNIVVGWENKKQ